MLQLGTKAPAFTLSDENGTLYTLEEKKFNRLSYVFREDISTPTEYVFERRS